MPFKTENEFQQLMDKNALYTKMPKAVLAALLVSYMDRLGFDRDQLDANLREEWQVLYVTGIVPQKPLK